jgi:GNAT superfamily N-acetyltransferase
MLALIERETAALFPPSALPPALAQPVPAAELLACMAASLLFVADDDAEGPVGFVACTRIGACLHIREMDVRPSFGRRGIGTRLLLHACALATERGASFATLTTFAHLPWNAPFYARRGFVTTCALDRFPHLRIALDEERVRGLANRVAMIRAA